MSANQIMIPIAGILLLAWVVYLVVRTRRISAAKIANAQREHRPNTPDGGHDKGAIMRSIMEGHAGSDR